MSICTLMVNKVIYTSHTDYFSSEHTLLGTQQHYQFAGGGWGAIIMWSKIKVLLSWTHSIFGFGRLDFITKTSPCNEHPLTAYFYIVKLGFSGVYIIFLFLHWNIDCGYLLEPPHWGGSNVYPRSMFWAKIWNISQFFIWKLTFLRP